MKQTFQSETAHLQSIILKTPEAAFLNQKKIDQEWERLNYSSNTDFETARTEYHQFQSIFENNAVKIHHLPKNEQLSLDSIYCRDASILTDKGAILCRMGKEERRGEQADLRELYRSLGIPILGKIEAPGIIEGGDTNWIDQNTLAVGRGYRTNDEGIRQLKNLTADNFEIVEVPLPHYKGPSVVFHLMTMLSPIDNDLFLVYSPLMPVPFRELLIANGIQLIEVPDEEFEMACNVLSIAPRKCIMLEGYPITKNRLEAAGAKVFTYKGLEISEKGCGGPTCLARPLWRKYTE